MGRWALILLAVMVVCAIAGFVIDAVRFVAGALFVVALVLFLGQWAARKLRR
ncbi:MAG: hypothetical protein ABW042_05565 [Phenylobacterium sp.]